MILILATDVSKKSYFVEELMKELSLYLKCSLRCRVIKEVKKGRLMLKNKEKVLETSNMKTPLTLKDLDQFKRHQEVPRWEQEVVCRAQPFKTKVNLRLLKKDNILDLAHNMKVPNTKDQLLEAISENKTRCKIDKETPRTSESLRNSR